MDLPRIRNPERFQNDEDFLEHMEFGLVYGDYGKPTLKSVTNRLSRISFLTSCFCSKIDDDVAEPWYLDNVKMYSHVLVVF